MCKIAEIAEPLIKVWKWAEGEADLQVADVSVVERQDVDHGPAAYVERVAALRVVHADVVLRFVEVEPGGFCEWRWHTVSVEEHSHIIKTIFLFFSLYLFAQGNKPRGNKV